MGYMHIDNLYKLQDILMFKKCYALEKIHGSSAHVSWDGNQLHLFSGGESHEQFAKIFNQDALKAKFLEMGIGPGRKAIVFGEVYGGRCQAMSHTYGKELKFIAFDVNIDECWLDVPKAECFVKDLGLEFVHYVKVSTDLAALDAERDAPSVQAVRNGVTTSEDFMNGKGKMREGIVLRPLVELRKNNGSRIICKHKGEKFQETKTPRPVVDPAKMQVLADAETVAEEWVTATRLQHVLDKLPGHSMEKMREIIAAMTEDVLREGSGEIVESETVKKAIGKKTALAYKDYLKVKLHEQAVS